MKVAGNFQHVQLIPSLMQVIIEVNDCALGLMGESQEEDRRLIADLVLEEMETRCGLMPQELMVSISNLWFRLKTPSCSGPMSAPWCCSNQVIRSCHRYMISIRLDRQQVLRFGVWQQARVGDELGAIGRWGSKEQRGERQRYFLLHTLFV